MVKARKIPTKKASKTEETVSTEDAPIVEDGATAIEETVEDIAEESSQAQENIDSVKYKSEKQKGKTSKKEETEDLSDEKENITSKQNGAGDSSVKKKSATKKASKAQKPQAEPARKSSRTPKPVVGKESNEAQEKNDEKVKSTNKRSASASNQSKKKTKQEEKDYEVESVVGHRVKSGKTEYKIRWKGYKASADSWEPEDNLSCQDLISKYLEDHSGETKVEVKKVASKSKSAKKTKAK